ncbi:hypothetical protein PUN28_008971 [Cardiocondyla obscurior]|uniref:Uncharacterized protein n=1 Tax=Cardiocondyla obscurior TaxID=286306 RepID=A0AAW2FT90_9HYME
MELSLRETQSEIAFAFLWTLTKRITGTVSERNKRNSLRTTCEKRRDFPSHSSSHVRASQVLADARQIVIRLIVRKIIGKTFQVSRSRA